MNPLLEKNISDCFTIDFEHKKDDRDWKTIENLAAVPGLVSKDRFGEALAILDDQEKSMNDFDFIYAWKAFVFQKQQKYDQAEKILVQGINKARAKNLLCDRLGYLYYDTGNIENAVKWWIKSILIMTRNKASFLWEPFLYLAYTARACNRKKEYQLLINIASESHGELALKKEAEADLLAKVANLKTSFVPQAIQTLGTLLEPSEPEDNSNLENRSEENKRDTPEDQNNYTQENSFSFGWKWVVAALFFATAAAFFLFSASLNRPNQVRQSAVQDPVMKNTDAPISSDNSQPQGTLLDQPVDPIAAESEKAPDSDRAYPFEEKTPLSASNSNTPVDHKMKAVHLKSKTKQPISKLQKKTDEQIDE